MKNSDPRPENTPHLRLSTEWIERSIESAGGAGSSAGYHLFKGWLPAYPETTGYLIPTLLEVSKRTGEKRFNAAAKSLARWLVSIQRSDGSFPGGLEKNEGPYVFDTGQILLGLLAIQSETQDEDHHENIEMAYRWICGVL